MASAGAGRSLLCCRVKLLHAVVHVNLHLLVTSTQSRLKGTTRLINLCVSESVPPWECGAIFKDIKRLAAPEIFSFRWRPRSANKASHWEDQASLHGCLPPNWVAIPPPALELLLRLS
ncbi:hypothetical protein LOK49_LG02G00087 [Camellia lanceoleosa]|uniref:Uncharacterized protein n=1 Tax=Camellia lanceoleosa TaxID=1840588 RepID=A0ACC0INM0_9ERIC|nr:hypothetical protein LOK49_LG02G00087 [Camellia lanceoleosa]